MSWPPPGALYAAADPGEARKNILFVHPRPFVAFNVWYPRNHPVFTGFSYQGLLNLLKLVRQSFSA
jgi:hypothetical protein